MCRIKLAKLEHTHHTFRGLLVFLGFSRLYHTVLVRGLGSIGVILLGEVAMSYALIADDDRDDSASDLSGFTPAESLDGDDQRYLSDGVAKLRDLAEAGYISDGEEQRRKELIEQFVEYQWDLGDYDDDLSISKYIFYIFKRCWRGFMRTLTLGGLYSPTSAHGESQSLPS